MKVLITGGAGYLGTVLTEEILSLRKGYRLR
jgi:nucleoside-diphosphate-sugar epimerase